MLTSANVINDSGLSTPSAVSAADFVNESSLVNSIALDVVGSAGSNASIVSGTDAPATMPGLRSGATLVSEPSSVFFTSIRHLPVSPRWKDSSDFAFTSCAPHDASVSALPGGVTLFCSTATSRSASSCCLSPSDASAALVSLDTEPLAAASASAFAAICDRFASNFSSDFITTSIVILMFLV